MKKFNQRYFILIFVLGLLLMFIIGIRLGKKIERSDRRAQELKTAKNQSSQQPDFAVKKFISKACGVTFVYPSLFKEENEATDEARLTDGKEIITLLCDKYKMSRFLTKKKKLSVTKTFTVDEVEITIYPSEVPDTVYLYFLHPDSEKQILARMPNELLSLFQSTLVFER